MNIVFSVFTAPGKSFRPNSARNASDATLVESSKGIPLESAVLTRPLKIAAIEAASIKASLVSLFCSFILAFPRLSEPLVNASPNSISSFPAGTNSAPSPVMVDSKLTSCDMALLLSRSRRMCEVVQ